MKCIGIIYTSAAYNIYNYNQCPTNKYKYKHIPSNKKEMVIKNCYRTWRSFQYYSKTTVLLQSQLPLLMNVFTLLP